MFNKSFKYLTGREIKWLKISVVIVFVLSIIASIPTNLLIDSFRNSITMWLLLPSSLILILGTLTLTGWYFYSIHKSETRNF